MTRCRRLTRAEKVLLAKEGYNPKYFLRLRKRADFYEFVEITSGKILTLRR